MSSPPGSSSSIPFKSKKRLFDSPCSKSQSVNPDSSSSAPFPTPEKPPENRSAKEIRQAAGSHRGSEDPPGKVSSARSKLVFSSSSSTAEKEKLPEKYETLGKFFDALDSSIVLSRLRGSKPTFSSISGKIEHLTERRFCYSHLAQIKYILPEAIEIKRVLIQVETTCCMKPDLHVTLKADAVEDGDKSKKISLRKVFRARLAAFVKAHPQGDEVPEEPLPELFSRRKLNENSTDEVKSVVSSVMEEMASIPAAKLISSFMKVPSTPVKSASSSSSTAPTASPALSKINLAPTPVKAVSTPASVPSTPAKIDSSPAFVASTPPEFASTPVRMFSTSLAEARLKKRSGDDTNLDDVTTDQPFKLARRSSLSSSRSLNFDSYAEVEKAMDVTDVDEDEDFEQDASSDDEILSILPDDLRQSIKEQERKAIEDSNPAISEAKRRIKMIACLPKLFNVILYLIQSIRRWVITKEELVHKIIAGHSDIIDRREVEEQLVLMHELVPEWISEKRSSCGDLLVCINKLASPETIRSSLEEENKKAMAPPLS
ncbi:CDT1-like protein a [Hirschfeldia incana]|nr:CDT1-like protein a [Hirschfeldia incana]